VEATLMPGKGELILTGQLGEVMQESARAALSYAKANLKTLGVNSALLENYDLHVHVPAGAIPKDGPSAGTAMATAVISALTGRAVNTDVAMTGEITLRGRVLPIGGLREKSLGALQGNVYTVIMPEKNSKDLVEIPANVKRKLKFVKVRHMDEVLALALEPAPKARRAPRKKATGPRTRGRKTRRTVRK
jgi:ATP-dependent Lon protease